MSHAYRACSQLRAGSLGCATSRAPTLSRIAACKLFPITQPRAIHGHGRTIPSVRSAWPSSSCPSNWVAGRWLSNTAAEARAKRDEDEETARETNQRDVDQHERDVKQAISETTKQQIRRPWHREGADEPPVSKHRTEMNRNMVKGKLLTTPTRLLKLILPLPVDAVHDEHGNTGEFRALGQNQDIQPLALLIHPQQPLSYLERLIQAELPPTTDKDGREKMPNVYFLAEAAERDEDGEQRENHSDQDKDSHVVSYSGLGREGEAPPPDSHEDWVRWSSSTEIGDFIRDAARGREFAIVVDGQSEMRVSVPSFNDRTHFMRVRLRRLSRKIEEQSKIKQECDRLAHRGAHRLAQAGFGAISVWWGTVYYLTFHTDLGWDYMEPVTYLAGLGTIMGGYLWFLFISRELSYQAALKITVSRRQAALYQARGFDANVWEAMVQDANELRHEVRRVAEEYDIEYDEAKDLGSEDMVEVLEKEEKRQLKKKTKQDEEDDEDAANAAKAPKETNGTKEKSSESKPRSKQD
ncbi:uncharacterized protein B0I36DRAFT_12426 [Microdochium trichocladiopsis]|uniref:Calcium uniporter protein, mitochondrial n=1 Tax=Microdochium trichocladiopsis TaxID=1682393 RepID=A0A9P8YHE8_9PEZI|nr:uncharacterized protein B0I36DRAFT_12426 [Microdochium trichocladiopsis]KAH7040566.1 hypothetical protein B0I36DRAFT_12426 [Microdochium trichocladiopsis]